MPALPTAAGAAEELVSVALPLDELWLFEDDASELFALDPLLFLLDFFLLFESAIILCLFFL